jgi:hypothetical protein
MTISWLLTVKDRQTFAFNEILKIEKRVASETICFFCFIQDSLGKWFQTAFLSFTLKSEKD